MSLRVRLTLFTAAVVALAVAAVAVAAQVAASRELRGEIDEFLESRVVLFGGTGTINPEDLPIEVPIALDFRGSGGPFVEADSVVQIISAEGQWLLRTDPLPIEPEDMAVASGQLERSLRDIMIDEIPHRILVVPANQELFNSNNSQWAVQVARSLEETNAILEGLKSKLWLVGAVGVAMAAIAGWLVAGRALVPVGQLTEAAEHVAATRDLNAPIRTNRSDEVGRLARSFNAMLAALSESQIQQQRLVADAGHELRTPLTSLRTNIELLAKAENLPETERRELMADATAELEELSGLAAELVELATDQATDEAIRDLRIDEIATFVAERSSRRWNRTVTVAGPPTVTRGRHDRVERAISNLVANAVKWGPEDDPISISIDGESVSVRDRGPGIDDADLERIFDRFYRATSSRTMPGSGLGLAIVQQVAEEHGGSVFARNADDGGAIVGFTLPGAEMLNTGEM